MPLELMRTVGEIFTSSLESYTDIITAVIGIRISHGVQNENGGIFFPV